MKKISFFLFLFFILFYSYALKKTDRFVVAARVVINDTIPNSGDSATNVDSKVIIGSNDNQIEISPLSSVNAGALIQPINKISNKGVSTAFYMTDTASWSFYTDGRQRLSINGVGNITSSVPLLINIAQPDSTSALRVNGLARIDTSLTIQAADDALSFISLNRKVKSVYDGQDDGVSPYTSTPTAWASSFDNHVPVFRIRHPNNVSSGVGNTSTLRDFLILPYQYGFAIEFNGVVECWVGEWSIHRNDFYKDTEGKGDGYGAVMWVGDDQDGGGVRVTARNNSHKGGNVQYGELSVEKFGLGDVSNGDFRFRLPSTQNQFHFVYGGRGSTNIVAKVSDKGFFLPKTEVDSIATPEKGQIFFDSAQSRFKGYDGAEWKDLANDIITGHTDSSANGTDSVYKFAHGLSVKPSYFNVLATSVDAANISYATADDTFIYIYYTVPPAAGTNNLSWNWQIKR